METCVTNEPAVQPLNDLLVPAKGKAWGCQGCKLFQYAPCFKKSDRAEYQATLDPLRFEKRNETYRMESVGPDDAEVMALFDWPTAAEDETHRAFAGGGAKVVKRNAAVSKIDTDEWRWTYLVRCRPPEDKLSIPAATYCSRFLAEEIVRVKPKIIIAFGATVLTALLGKQGTKKDAKAKIDHYVCNPQRITLSGHECVVYPMHAPWFIYRNSYLSETYQEHFDKLAGFIRGDTAVKVDSSLKNVITDPDEAIRLCERFVAKMEAGRTVEVDLETSGLNPHKVNSRISVVSLCLNTNKGYAIMLNHDEVRWTEKDRQRVIRRGLKPLLRHRQAKLRLHNGKFDYQWIRKHMGFWPRDIIEDTMLTHYSVNENVEHGLKPLALLFTDMGDYDAELEKVLAAQTYPDRPRYDLVTWKLLGKYAAMDGIATRKLAKALAPEVAEQGEFVTALARRAMPAFSSTLTRMEYNGVSIDLKFAREKALPFVRVAVAKSMDAILSQPKVRAFIRDGEAEKRALMKRPKPPEVKRYFAFSLGSGPQMQSLLFDEKYYGHTPILFTKSGAPSTDKETMQELANKGSPIATAITEHRLDEKLLSTYIDPIIRRCTEQQDNLLHGSFLLHGTRTGRLSSKQPNLQNIPNKGAGIIKRMYVSRYGEDGVFLQIDFSQIELRILAALSNDPNMVDAYRTGKDLHMLTACLIFNMTEEQYRALDDKEQKRRRTVAKRVNFGIAYGIGGPGIQHTLKMDGVTVTEDEARGYLDTFFEKYPRVERWIESVERSTQSDEHSLSLFGRRRRLLAVRSEDDDQVAQALRQGVNHVIQSTAGDMTMTALTLMDQEICIRSGRRPEMTLPTITPREFEVDSRWKRVQTIVQVHDMIGLDCHKDIAAEATDRLLDTMQNVIDYAPLVWGDCVTPLLNKLRRVPILAEAEVGPNWRDAYKVKNGAEIPKAMHVARVKQTTLDADPKYKWDKKDDEKALATFKAAA